MIEIKNNLFDTPNYYTSYFIDDKPRPHIIITPGGAYVHCSKREGKPVGDVFFKAGYNFTIIEYRETLDFYPFPQKCVAKVINELRKDKRVSYLIGLGFSAGGHLILDVALHYKKYETSKLDLLMLSYPVVTSNEKYSHVFSLKSLLGDKYDDKKLLEFLSLEKQITKDAPELFIWNTITDEAVNPYNSLKLVEAYYENGVNVEYHLYQKGCHGIALANEESSGGEEKYIVPIAQNWTKLAINWLNEKLK